MRKICLVAAALLFGCGSSNNGSGSGSGSGGPPAPVMRTLNLHVSGSGEIHGASFDCRADCQPQVADGQAVHLDAVPDSGWKFEGWQGDCSGAGGCDLTMSADHKVAASFSQMPPDDCAGLVPATPGAVSGSFTTSVLTFAHSTNPTICKPGFADGDGTLALQITDGRSGAGHETNFVSPAGALLNSALDGEVTITEQANGFIDSDFDGQDSLIHYDSKGNITAVSGKFDTVRAIATDPTGGAVALQMEPAGSVEAVTSVMLNAYDAQVAPRWQATLPAQPVAMAAVDRAGNTLVIIDGDNLYGPRTVAGIWVDHGGKVGAEFKLHDAMPSGSPAHNVIFTVAERVGSGLFIGAEGSWFAQLDALATTPAAPPAWLAARAVSNMHVVHGGHGYAVLPNAAAGDCAQTIDIVSPSGKTCGSQTFRAADGSCSTGAIRVGYDGTVVQQVPASGKCTWQWWSGHFG
jgi:Divergent InlB B-repeat domain